MNFLQKTSECSVKDHEGAIVATQFLAIVSLFWWELRQLFSVKTDMKRL